MNLPVRSLFEVRPIEEVRPHIADPAPFLAGLLKSLGMQVPGVRIPLPPPSSSIASRTALPDLSMISALAPYFRMSGPGQQI